MIGTSNRVPQYFHSYGQELDEEYLDPKTFLYMQEQQLFTYKCPVPSIFDYFTTLSFEEAYLEQQKQFFR